MFNKTEKKLKIYKQTHICYHQNIHNIEVELISEDVKKSNGSSSL